MYYSSRWIVQDSESEIYFSFLHFKGGIVLLHFEADKKAKHCSFIPNCTQHILEHRIARTEKRAWIVFLSQR